MVIYKASMQQCLQEEYDKQVQDVNHLMITFKDGTLNPLLKLHIGGQANGI
jgi:hypothetical protein